MINFWNTSVGSGAYIYYFVILLGSLCVEVEALELVRGSADDKVSEVLVSLTHFYVEVDIGSYDCEVDWFWCVSATVLRLSLPVCTRIII